MNRRRSLVLGMLSRISSQVYINRVLATEAASLIAYWPMIERSGTAADDASASNRDATYARNVTLMGTQPGIGDGNVAPVFNGSSDTLSLYSASLANAFNGAEGTFAAWVKVSDVGVWSDGVSRRIVTLQVDSNNYIYIDKWTTGFVLYGYRAGGAALSRSLGFQTPTDWVHVAITWSASANEVTCYFDGSQVGATLTGVGTWVGSLNTTWSRLGSYSSSAEFWKGQLAHAAIWTTALSGPEIAALSDF